jgi:hypothetical protein
MLKLRPIATCALALALLPSSLAVCCAADSRASLEKGFLAPPDSAKPWVYWFRLDGKALGTLWKLPYHVEIGQAAKAGDNTLEVKVTNLWINRMIGDEQLPEDCDRNANGTLHTWPQWLQEGKPSPAGRHTFTTWRLWNEDSPLVESGLLGPVTLKTAERIAVGP